VVGLAAGFYAIQSGAERLKTYLLLLLVMQAGLMGMFASVDVFFFYFFHELALIPTFIMVGIWGGRDRSYAAMTMTIYLTLGAMLSLLGLIAIYVKSGANSFDIMVLRDALASRPLLETAQTHIFGLLLFGFGIQRIEGELSRKFPTARVARMDSDTMTSAGQFRRVFEQFSSGELDILLGTQMVAKGLDFPRVSVVGVVSADTSLAIPDFRAAERTFQLIVQVAGRAGRADLPGEVVVQTLHPEEPSILLASRHDYDGFAAGELPSRKETQLPPFSRLVRFVVRHEDVEKARQAAETFASRLRPLLPADAVAVGPQIAGVPKIRNEYRFQLLVSCPRAGVVQQAVGENMESLCRDLPAELAADVDPVNLL